MKLLLKNPEKVVTCSAGGKLFKRGSEMSDIGIMGSADIYIEDGTIKEIGNTKVDSSCDVLDVSGKTLLPGFVDPHTHLIFAGTAEREFAARARGMNYGEIGIKGERTIDTSEKVREIQKSKLGSQAGRRIDKMFNWGTTTLEIKSGRGLNFKNEVKMLEIAQTLKQESIPDIIVTFLGTRTILPENKQERDTYIKILTDELIPYVAKKKFAEFCDVNCDEKIFTLAEAREILAAACEAGLKLKMHAGEHSADGVVGLAVEVGATSVDNLQNISQVEIPILARSDTIGVILPAASAYSLSKFAPARAMIDNDCAVALASGFNPGSSMVDNMQTTMWLAVCFNKMSVEEALNAATINAAAAVGLSHILGSIEIGKQADILIVDTEDYAYLPYHFTENKITNVVKRGTVLEIS
ncbi:MAG: imidazolonepropionase [Candidatus Kryptoniota bacterium]